MGRNTFTKLGTRQAMALRERRILVSELRLHQRMSQREIVQALKDRGIVNPVTRKPYSLATVNKDCQALEGQWQERISRNTDALKAELVAELDEIRRFAWSKQIKAKSGELVPDPDMKTVLDSLKQLRAVLGLDAPKSMDMTSGGQPIKAYVGISPDDWDEEEEDAEG